MKKWFAKKWVKIALAGASAVVLVKVLVFGGIGIANAARANQWHTVHSFEFNDVTVTSQMTVSYQVIHTDTDDVHEFIRAWRGLPRELDTQSLNMTPGQGLDFARLREDNQLTFTMNRLRPRNAIEYANAFYERGNFEVGQHIYAVRIFIPSQIEDHILRVRVRRNTISIRTDLGRVDYNFNLSVNSEITMTIMGDEITLDISYTSQRRTRINDGRRNRLSEIHNVDMLNGRNYRLFFFDTTEQMHDNRLAADLNIGSARPF